MTTDRTAEKWLAIPVDDLPVKLAEALTPGPWKHDQDPVCICKKCGIDFWNNAVALKSPCSVPDPIKIDLGKALERFRAFTRNELFEPMLDIARPHQPNGEFADMPVDQMLEIAERYCLREASARELWIICAMAMERSKE